MSGRNSCESWLKRSSFEKPRHRPSHRLHSVSRWDGACRVFYFLDPARRQVVPASTSRESMNVSEHPMNCQGQTSHHVDTLGHTSMAIRSSLASVSSFHNWLFRTRHLTPPHQNGEIVVPKLILVILYRHGICGLFPMSWLPQRHTSGMASSNKLKAASASTGDSFKLIAQVNRSHTTSATQTRNHTETMGYRGDGVCAICF